MASDPQDDALSWEGDERLDAPPDRRRAVGQSSGRIRPEPVPAVGDPDAQPSVGNAALIGLGIVGGIFLIYTIGWIVTGLRLQSLATVIVADAMFVPWLWLAALAPALWFTAVWVLTKDAAMWLRMLLLVAGIVLLVPWPFFMVGTVGA